MGLEFNINIKRKITVNGQEFGAVDEVPAELRQTVQNAMDSAQPGARRTRITVNGTGYDSPEAMPPDVRKTYEEALVKAGAAAREKGITLSEPGIKADFSLQLNPGAQPGPAGPVRESGLSLRTIIILIALAVLSILAVHYAPK